MRNFSARETVWLQELDGIELASFQRRAFAFLIDWILILIVLMVVLAGGVLGYLGVRYLRGQPIPIHSNVKLDEHGFEMAAEGQANKVANQAEKQGDSEWTHLLMDIAVPVLYFGLLTWRGHGRTPGKWLMKIRVVSTVHRHLTLWYSVERALGYGAAALELGFGFVQFFIHPYRRCAQDRLAETIVVTERGYQTTLSRP